MSCDKRMAIRKHDKGGARRIAGSVRLARRGVADGASGKVYAKRQPQRGESKNCG